MHIGHYHGALKNWIKLQEEYECLYFAADWHALTTHFDAAESIAESVWDMFIDWFAAGVNPSRATCSSSRACPSTPSSRCCFGMVTPVGWLERIPTYKDQQQKLGDRDLSNFGFLGYPVMQGADILVYRANMVPVGEDQVSHIELVREIARRFNHIYGREPGSRRRQRLQSRSSARSGRAATRSCARRSRSAATLRRSKRRRSCSPKRRISRSATASVFSATSKERDGWCCRSRAAAHRNTESSGARRPENVEIVRQRDLHARGAGRSHQEDPHDADGPGACRRSDKGDPNRCPVWALHQIYSDAATRDWVVKGCTTAGIGCLDCKQPVIDAIIREQEPIRERAQRYVDDPQLVRNIVADGCERARKLAEETMRDVRATMGLDYT
jgi:tryptophanyl-tRNA synthetase